MIVFTRNGKTVVITGWQAWLTGVVVFLAGLALMALATLNALRPTNRACPSSIPDKSGLRPTLRRPPSPYSLALTYGDCGATAVPTASIASQQHRMSY
jgi:hypothetical protein